ncbi:amidohydrolase family protein [Chloroflexi bacterium TSY]|nr:amidohydrolase family protein [Chloroflexi bacterium TSY]
MRTLIQGGWVIGFQNGHHTILQNGVIVMEDDRIIHVGPHFDGTIDQTIEARGKLISPGFVNIHAVANIDIQTLTLDCGEGGYASSQSYALDGVGELELSGDRLAASAQFSLVQLLKGGSTTIVEITTMAPSRFEVPRDEVPLLAQAATELGARIYLSHKFRAGKRYVDVQGIGHYHWDEDSANAALDYGCEMVKRYEGAQNGRLRTMLFPYQFDACTPELLQAVKVSAKELDVPVHMHTSQTLFEFHDCLRRYGRTPIQLLDDIDFLDDKTILTHVIYTTNHPQSGYPVGDKTDLQILADHGTHVAHCPVVYARRDRILGSFARYREMGINVPLGTDTFPQDMIEEMRWAVSGSTATPIGVRHGMSSMQPLSTGQKHWVETILGDLPLVPKPISSLSILPANILVRWPIRLKH